MQLIPAIDLRAGRCVRLLQGDFAAETRYAPDPSSWRAATGRSAQAGCTWSTWTAPGTVRAPMPQ